jgi:ATP-dependent DNA helicase RecG
MEAVLHMPSYIMKKHYEKAIKKELRGEHVVTAIVVEVVDVPRYSGGKHVTVVYGRSGSEPVRILLFNYKRAYARSVYKVDSTVIISGKLGEAPDKTAQFINPEKLSSCDFSKKVEYVPVYPLCAGLSQRDVHSIVSMALLEIKANQLPEWLPQDIMQVNNFKSYYESIEEIHHPQQMRQSTLDTTEGRRVCFDELLAEQLVLRKHNVRTRHGQLIKNEKMLIGELLSRLPFSLTQSQEKAIQEIFEDLESGKPMARLLQGDVGSGKTIVAIITALYVIESGHQCAILAPTEILARQHHATFSQYLVPLGLNIALLTAAEKGKKRTAVLESLATGSIHVLIGTHAIITDTIKFSTLGLVVADEQHRFGVSQRLNLINKGVSPHVLSMTATPIPRTIVMSLYGDIAMSAITEKPAGRTEIVTKAIPLTRVADLVRSIKTIITSGQKVFWVCPIIEENEKLSYTCVINRFEYLKMHFGEGVEMLHGKMKSSEKQAIFEKFHDGACHILVATTVIEVGIDIRDASVIVIENAEKFGLAQLHQLRGRVGRSAIQSYCILLFGHTISGIAKKRIETIVKSNDGFFIAEQDLELRGGGEVLGVRQSGRKAYKTFDIDDPHNQHHILSLLSQASGLATRIMEADKLGDYEAIFDIFATLNSENIKTSF